MSWDIHVRKIEQEISRHMPLDRFLQIQMRLEELRKDEDEKLKALAELQRAYLAANSERDQELVKVAVGKIRELSKLHRAEVRDLKLELSKSMSLQVAQEYYQRLVEARAHSPK